MRNLSAFRVARGVVGCARALTMVALVLFAAFGSVATLAAALITLICGLIATAAFAAAAIGSLNLISVAFGILYIGLGIDFIIHLTLRAQELANEGQPVSDALPNAARDVGASLTICAITTAGGFYSFIPTAFDGVAELGLIAGTGMFISLFATLTLLPALLTVTLRNQQAEALRFRRIGAHLLEPVTRRRSAVLIVACILGVVSLMLIDEIRFDSDPINLRDAKAESVQTFLELQDKTNTGDANLVILSSGTNRTTALKESLQPLTTVRSVISIHDFVPAEQDEKLFLLEDLDIALGPGFGKLRGLQTPAPERLNSALASLRASIAGQRDARLDAPVFDRLGDSIDRWFAKNGDASDATDGTTAARLQTSVLADLPAELKRLKKLLLAQPIEH